MLRYTSTHTPDEPRKSLDNQPSPVSGSLVVLNMYNRDSGLEVRFSRLGYRDNDGHWFYFSDTSGLRHRVSERTNWYWTNDNITVTIGQQ